MTRQFSLSMAASIFFSVTSGCTTHPCDNSSDRYREDIFTQTNHSLIVRFYPPQSIYLANVDALVSQIGATVSCVDRMVTGSMSSHPCYIIKFPGSVCYSDAERQMFDLYHSGSMSIALPRPESPCDCESYWSYVANR